MSFAQQMAARRKQTITTTTASAKSPGKVDKQLLPARKGVEVVLVSDDASIAVPAKPSGAPKYHAKSLTTLLAARQHVVRNISDLDLAGGDALTDNLLRAWSVIIKEGHAVRELSSHGKLKVTQFAARKHEKVIVRFSEKFQRKHPSLLSLFCGREGC